MAVKTKKANVKDIVLLAVAAVAAILTIVMFTLAWVKSTVTVLGQTKTNSGKLTEIYDAFKEVPKEFRDGSKIPAMYAFALLGMLFAILSMVVTALHTFLDLKPMKFAALAVGALTVLFCILSIALTYAYAADIKVDGMTVGADFGAWLLTIFGIVAGAIPLFLGVKGMLKSK